MTAAEIESKAAIAYRMHLDGHSLSAIGKKLGFSKAYAQHLVTYEAVRVAVAELRGVAKELRNPKGMHRNHAANKIDKVLDRISKREKS